MQYRLEGRAREYVGGALMFALGAGAAALGTTYGVGTLEDMGPGFFPTAVGAILALAGMAIAFTGAGAASPSHSAPPDDDAGAVMQWRGWGCIALGIVLFVVFAAHLGLLPATFAIVFVSALGDRRNTVANAFVLSLAVCVVGVVVFWWALRIQLPLARWG
ncbi:MAG TPA: tripartite tricarboxylate transporter TctB family protein [Paraburkholderia sp.]